jgi:hypothetical protein
MFSAKLERRQRLHRLAILVAATLLVVGIALIAIWAVRASSMLQTADADRAPIILGVLIALAGSPCPLPHSLWRGPRFWPPHIPLISSKRD